jgi:hypothetical protein
MDDGKKLTIRLPKELHDRLVALAEQDTRSLNGEIVALLRAAVAERDRQSRPSSE